MTKPETIKHKDAHLYDISSRHELRCNACLESFYVTKKYLDKKFCCKECYFDNLSKNGRPNLLKPKHTLTCEFCSSEFQATAKSFKTGRRFCSLSCKARWQATLPYEDWRAKIGEKNKVNSAGHRNPMYGKSPGHGKFCDFVDRKGRKLKFRSRWELAVAKYLDICNLNWDYEPKRFKLPNGTTYCPDFFIHETNCFWEVKGWYHDRAKLKTDMFRANYKETPLVLLTKNCIKGIGLRTGTELGLAIR